MSARRVKKQIHHHYERELHQQKAWYGRSATKGGIFLFVSSIANFVCVAPTNYTSERNHLARITMFPVEVASAVISVCKHIPPAGEERPNAEFSAAFTWDRGRLKEGSDYSISKRRPRHGMVRGKSLALMEKVNMKVNHARYALPLAAKGQLLGRDSFLCPALFCRLVSVTCEYPQVGCCEILSAPPPLATALQHKGNFSALFKRVSGLWPGPLPSHPLQQQVPPFPSCRAALARCPH